MMSNEKILSIGFNEDHRIKCKLTHDPDDQRYLYLTPQDVDLPKRYQEAYDDIHDKLEELSKLNRNPATDEEARATIDAIYEAGRFIKEKIDYVFGNGVSETVFGQVSCLTVDNNTGEYLFEKFLNCMNHVIEEAYGVSVKKVNARISKYTDSKGSHPALNQ